ncbi:hypothetical protein ABZW30_38370 [Kitasatospora sp. NPDC004669]|uniref:hypothetical protein n=1 Tax=Kitasatospora sp. NPDC004669 TaxID=3154555 RepID=UPI0033ABBB26
MPGFLNPGNVSDTGQEYAGLTGEESNTPRTDDVLAEVTAPTAAAVNPFAGEVSHLQAVHADLVARRLVPGRPTELERQLPTEAIPEAYAAFIRAHT